MATTEYKNTSTLSISRARQIHVAPSVDKSDTDAATIRGQNTTLRSLKCICAFLATSIVVVAATFGWLTHNLMEKIEHSERLIAKLESNMGALGLNQAQNHISTWDRLTKIEDELMKLGTNQTDTIGIADMHTRLTNLETDFHEHETSAQDESERLNAIENKTETQQQALRNLSIIVDALITDSSTEWVTVQEYINETENIWANLATEMATIEEHGTALLELRKDWDSVTDMVQNHDSKVTQIESDQPAVHSSLHLLSTMVAQLETDMETQSFAIEKHDENLLATINSLQQLQADIIVQDTSIQDATARLAQLELSTTDDRANILLQETKITQIKTNLTELNDSLTTQGSTIEDLELQGKLVNGTLSNNTARLIELEANLGETDANMLQLQTDIDIQNNSIHTVNEQLAQLALNVTELRENIFLQQNRIMQVESSMTAQNISLNTQISKIEELESQGIITKDTLSNHTAELIQLETDLSETEANIQCVTFFDQAQTAQMLEQELGVDKNFGACEDGFRPYGASCYMFSTDSLGWAAADNACVTLGSQLVEITDACENAFIKSIVYELGGEFWLGGSDHSQEGDWRWVNSQTKISNSTFNDWGPDRPDNFESGEDYLVLADRHIKNDWYWEDVSGTSIYQYICEMGRWS